MACLEMLGGADSPVVSVNVESRQDVFDLELHDAHGDTVASRQIKNRALERAWNPSDILPLIRRWATSTHLPDTRFELRLGGRAGPAAQQLVDAIRSAAEGDPSRLVEQSGSNLNAAELEAARFVDVIIDPTSNCCAANRGHATGTFFSSARTHRK